MSSSLTQSFTPVEFSVVISMGVISGCIPALQPLLLGGLLDRGHLNVVQIGQSATSEALGMVFATTVAAILLKPNRLKPITIIALLGALVVNSLTVISSGIQVVVLRGISGLCSGVLLWVLLGLLSRSASPGRAFAVYVTAQAIASFILSSLITHWLVDVAGADGGYLIIAFANLVLMAAALVMPASYTTIESENRFSRPPIHGLWALLSITLLLASILGFWVYIIPIGKSLGYSTDSLNSVISIAIGAQVIAGLCATALSTALKPFRVFVIGALLIIGSIVLFMTISHPLVLYSSLIVFSFVWMFVPPFQLPLLIELDPSLRSAIFIGTAQLSGVAFGPIFAAQIIGVASKQMAANSSIVLAMLSIGCLYVASLLHGTATTHVAKTSDSNTPADS
ncbi:MFS transporter [Parahaliea maris]|uniref:MFS transporter n=1 Tax=Parahaliea maris TaxID=2716870 RepID=A0A5C9A6Q5_9GAMM|nr:MFS transporter [Parahaliea maris]TXS96468.1 MFS transporter [Parahaliea maris]